MLVLTRKENEQIRIGSNIVLTVVRCGNDKVRLGIEAPSDTVILRSELKERRRALDEPERCLDSGSAACRKAGGRL